MSTQGYVDARYLQAVATLLNQIKQHSYTLMHVQPGHRVLDVGCGPGIDTVALARLVGPTGQVVGVDTDAAMLSATRRNAEETKVSGWVRHEESNASTLPFASGSFDACRSERLFQHLSQPEEALDEMARVTRSEGWIVVVDTDWGTMSIDHPEIDIERRIARVLAERSVHQGYAGRQLYRLLKQQGLKDVSIEIFPIAITHYAAARQIGQLDSVEQEALRSGGITQGELHRWHAYLEDADRHGVFFGSASVFIAVGQKQ